tara:strand:- start:21585 stop:22133 length:549 start_codon:yes stop_codon:yes gene_type:complete
MNAIVQKIIKKQIILYPTDTVWGIGCDATSEVAVNKIFKIKNRVESKSLIILVNSLEMLKEYITVIPDSVLNILTTATKPTTIIYENPKGLAKNVVASDNTVAIRIVKHDFCEKIIQQLGKPIVSTSANISGEPTPKSFSEISQEILDSVDYVVALEQNKKNNTSSRILRITGKNKVEVIRE